MFKVIHSITPFLSIADSRLILQSNRKYTLNRNRPSIVTLKTEVFLVAIYFHDKYRIIYLIFDYAYNLSFPYLLSRLRLVLLHYIFFYQYRALTELLIDVKLSLQSK